MHQGSQEKEERVYFDPTGNIPSTNREKILEPRPQRDAAAQKKLGLPEAMSFGSPPAAHHYLHEDPKEQGSHPDLDGQLPHGAAGVAPAAAAGAVRGSHGSARAARQSLGGEGGALQAAGGGGRRARGGGSGEGSAPISRSGLPDTQTPHRPLQVPLAIPPIGGASGTPCSFAPSAVSVFWAPAWHLRPGRGSLGKPRCCNRGLPCALRGFPATGRPLGSAPARQHALPAFPVRLLSSPRLRLLLSAPSTHARTWA